MKILTYTLALVMLASLGCRQKTDNQDDAALHTLSSPQPSDSFGPGFWTDQSRKNTDLWRKAVAFCTQPPNKLLANCQNVLVLNAPTVPYSTTMPADSPKGGLNSAP